MALRDLFKRKRTEGGARTAGYQPVLTHFWHQPRDLPLFGFEIIRSMLLDPTVRLSLAMRAAPLSGVQWAYQEGEEWTPGVRCRRPEVAAFVLRQLSRIWTGHLTSIAKAQVWGWSAGEVTHRLSESNLVEVNRLEPRQAQDCRLLIGGGRRRGVQVRRVKHVGSVDLHFPNAWFHAHDPEDGEHYGRSVLLGAYSPWADKCLQGGACDVRRLFMHKDAYGGTDLGYPEGSDFYDDEGNSIPNRDIARQIVEQLAAGGVTTRPSTRDENGNERWPLTRATVPANPQHILQFPKDLDGEIRSGILIPDGVIDDDGASGAWAGKRIPLAAFYASLDAWVNGIVADLTEQVFEPLVLLNFGEAIDFEVTHKPLAQQAMEQQSNAGGGFAGEGDPSSLPGGVHWNPAALADGTSGGRSSGGRVSRSDPRRMSLDAVQAVGEGVLDASAIVEAARTAMRMAAGDFDESNVNRDKGEFASKPGETKEQQTRSGKQPSRKISAEEIDKHPPVKHVKPSKTFKNFAEARNWARENVISQDGYLNASLGMRIQVSSNSLQKVMSGSAASKSQAPTQDHIDLVGALPELIQGAVVYETHADRENDRNIAAIHRMVSAAQIGDRSYAVKMTVKERRLEQNEASFYSYQLDELEVAAPELPDARSGRSDPQAATFSSLRNLLVGFKFNDGSPVLGGASDA